MTDESQEREPYEPPRIEALGSVQDFTGGFDQGSPADGTDFSDERLKQAVRQLERPLELLRHLGTAIGQGGSRR